MTTRFENKISMGNVLTALGMLAAIILSYADLNARQGNIESQTAALIVRADSTEVRTRALEQGSATTSVRYESLAEALAELKVDVRQTNDLLRRILEDRQ